AAPGRSRHVARPRCLDLGPRVVRAAPAARRAVLAGLDELVHLEEVLDLGGQLPRDVGEVVHLLPAHVAGGHADHLGVLALVVLWMEDDKGEDAKVICVPARDVRWEQVNDLANIPRELTAEIQHFYEVYKLIEPEIGRATC